MPWFVFAAAGKSDEERDEISHALGNIAVQIEIDHDPAIGADGGTLRDLFAHARVNPLFLCRPFHQLQGHGIQIGCIQTR